MYFIHALQACCIFTVPSLIPQDLYQQFTDLQISDLLSQEVHIPRSPRSMPELRVASMSSPGSHPSPPALRSGSPSPKPSDRDWDVTPQQKQELDRYYKINLERKGYVDEDTAANFMLAYQLPPGDLTHIWYVSSCRRV